MPLPPDPPAGGEKKGPPPKYEVELDQALLDSLQPEDREILKEMDGDKSGKVELGEMLALLRHHRDTKRGMSKLFTTFIVVVFGLVLLLAVNTIATFVVVEMAKENKVKGTSMVSAASGKTVETENEDMAVDADGNLKPKKTDANGTRRLAAGSSSIKTVPTLKKVELASSLPDKTLMGLDELTIYSDKGHTLQVKLHGFSRVPVLNSACGNVVHFYTAWKGRITLDSKAMSFDEVTAAEFKNAGFSLAVGGMGGRRLAGKSKTDGFFKSMEGLKKSGKWKCAGIPLPQMADTNKHTDTVYQPCGTKLDSGKPKKVLDLCDSQHGGLVPGASQLPKHHALATRTKTARIRALLKSKTPEVIYLKSKVTSLRSKGYSVQFTTYPNHHGQILVDFLDRTTKASVSFQTTGTEARSHCAKAGTDTAGKALESAKADSAVDTDMHFEFLETVEEDTKVFRHFRMMSSDAFNKYMGIKGTRPADGYTEYWDWADTLTPYRILSGDGSLTVYESMTSSCTDAEVKAAIAEKTAVDFSAILTCTEAEKDTKVRPAMVSPYTDLDMTDVGYYASKVFGTQTAAMTIAKDTDDVSAKALFARYLERSWDLDAMPDICSVHCKEAVDEYKKVIKKGQDPCKGDKTLSNVIACLSASGMSQCTQARFLSEHFEECGRTPEATPEATRRMLEEAEDGGQYVPEQLVPVKTLADGTQYADLSQGSPQLQLKLAKHLGIGSSSRLLFNGTKEQDGEEHFNALVESPQESRRLFSTSCNSKLGAVTWMGDGWCMKWEFSPTGFKLSIKWGNVGGYIGIALTCQACVDLSKFFGVPPPLKVDFCVGGSISVTSQRACPQIPLTISGKVYWYIEGLIDLSVLSISIAKLEVGIQAAISSFTAETGCWWVCGEGRRRRRRWWSRRRRNWRACNYRLDCDVKVGGYVAVSAATFKVQFDETYWIKAKCMTVTVTAYVFEFWKLWWGGWKNMYSTEVMRYYF